MIGYEDPLVEHPSTLGLSGHCIGLTFGWLHHGIERLAYTRLHVVCYLDGLTWAWLGLLFSNALALMDDIHMWMDYL
jgi:hypothetical protein